MSDYMFMLDSHLTPGQGRALAAVEATARSTGDRVYLAGGALRDMLGGFPITDLDFSVQGNALSLAKRVAEGAGARIVSSDPTRQSAELVFPGGETAEISLSRVEQYGKPGARPKVVPAAIQDDLLRRDFSINAIALSLHPASRGLLLDPANGLGDLERRELRALGNYGFYDDPVRLLRLIRLKVRLGFEIESRTRAQYESAREAGMEKNIPERALFLELRRTAEEPSSSEILAAFEKEKLIGLFSPAFEGGRANLAVLARLDKARQMIPHGTRIDVSNLGTFLFFLTEKLTPKEKAELISRLKIPAEDLERWQKLEPRSRKLEKDLKSRALHRPSLVYDRLLAAAGDEALFLYLRSPERIVHDRIRNFLQKYLSVAQEVTDREAALAAGVELTDPRLPKFKEEIVASRLDNRKWSPPEAPPAAPALGDGTETRAQRSGRKPAPRPGQAGAAARNAAGRR